MTGKSIKYSEMERLVQQTVGNLQASGLKTGDALMVYSHDCVEIIVIFLAASSMGVTFSYKLFQETDSHGEFVTSEYIFFITSLNTALQVFQNFWQCAYKLKESYNLMLAVM